MLTKDLNLQPRPRTMQAGEVYNFFNLLQLEYLVVSNVKFNSFIELSNLRVLTVINCNMRLITSDDFKNMPALESLSIDQLKNNTHVSFHQLKRLHSLEVRHAQNYEFLARLPEKLAILRLEAFDVAEFDNMRHANLQTLDFISYKLHSFDCKRLAGLTNLRHLRIKKSVLYKINLDYAFLSKLETLSLERNLIQDIDLSRLVNLRLLDLSYNRSLVVSKSTFAAQADKLEELYITAAFLTGKQVKQASLSNLSQLKVLDLSENKIRRFEMECLAGLKNLRHLNMRENPCYKIDPNQAAKLFPKLEKLEQTI